MAYTFSLSSLLELSDPAGIDFSKVGESWSPCFCVAGLQDNACHPGLDPGSSLFRVIRQPEKTKTGSRLATPQAGTPASGMTPRVTRKSILESSEERAWTSG